MCWRLPSASIQTCDLAHPPPHPPGLLPLPPPAPPRKEGPGGRLPTWPTCIARPATRLPGVNVHLGSDETSSEVRARRGPRRGGRAGRGWAPFPGAQGRPAAPGPGEVRRQRPTGKARTGRRAAGGPGRQPSPAAGAGGRRGCPPGGACAPPGPDAALCRRPGRREPGWGRPPSPGGGHRVRAVAECGRGDRRARRREEKREGEKGRGRSREKKEEQGKKEAWRRRKQRRRGKREGEEDEREVETKRKGEREGERGKY